VEIPSQTIGAAQRNFAAEPVDIPAVTKLAPLVRLSHTSLKTYRDCPYRFLLEKGLGLREEEEVLEAFRRLDYGNIVHECLRRFLSSDAPGHRALVAGDRERALASLRKLAEKLFGEGAEAMPQRRLWEETFLALSPQIIDFELTRFTAGWRPAYLEQKFTFTLGDLSSWLQECETASRADGAVPAATTTALPRLDQAMASFKLEGKIDRIDRRLTEEGDSNPDCPDRAMERYSVIDYKTGLSPSNSDVREGRDLQIVLYALAVELGGMAALPRAGSPRVSEGAYYQLNSRLCGFNLQKPHLAATDNAGRTVVQQGARLILDTALAAQNRAGPYPLIPEFWQGMPSGVLPCRICPYQAVCRLEERQLSPVLQRTLASDRARVARE
jgi:RecB family exonuclease